MALAIEQIEKARGRFYAPAFDVAVSKKSVVHDLHLEVTSVQVDLILEAAGRFSFAINNSFDISKREFLKVGGKTLPEFLAFGSPVEIRMGYGDRSKLDLMLTGVVTELSTSFPSSGSPTLTVSGYDNSYCLTKGTKSQNWSDKKDSDVVRLLAGDFNLTPKVDDTQVVHRTIERSQESAAQFITRLAHRNGFEFFVVERDLVFRRPANDQQGVIEAVWGRGLVSFSPEIKLSEQVTQVEVYGWDVQNKRPIVGRANRGDESGRDSQTGVGKPRASGAQYLQKVCKESEATLRVREPVFSQQEADQRARAILQRRAEGFVGGRGESIGIPEIRANANVSLKGLGDYFSTTFYVQQATHTVDSSGYRTTFEVKDTTI